MIWTLYSLYSEKKEIFKEFCIDVSVETKCDYDWSLGRRCLSFSEQAALSVIAQFFNVSLNLIPDMKGPESSHCPNDNILSNPYSGIQFAFDKRRRNLEKRKVRTKYYSVEILQTVSRDGLL